jgi:hypothetical protein
MILKYKVHKTERQRIRNIKTTVIQAVTVQLKPSQSNSENI